MTKYESLMIVRRIFSAEGSESELLRLVNMIDREFPNADMVNLIFHDPRDPTPEQVVDEAFEREAAYARQGSQG